MRRTMATFLCSVLLAVMCSSLLAESPVPDALDEALAAADLTRADLGWEARGWWQRYPQDIPYKLRHFDDLCAEPLAVIPFVRVMGATLMKDLAAEEVAGAKGQRGAGALYRAVHQVRSCPSSVDINPIGDVGPAGHVKHDWIMLGAAEHNNGIEAAASHQSIQVRYHSIVPFFVQITGKKELTDVKYWFFYLYLIYLTNKFIRKSYLPKSRLNPFFRKNNPHTVLRYMQFTKRNHKLQEFT